MKITNYRTMRIQDVVSIDPEVMGGTSVFKGTRVPIKSLFDYLEIGENMDEFLENFPSVTKVQVQMLLSVTSKMYESRNLVYEDCMGKLINIQ